MLDSEYTKLPMSNGLTVETNFSDSAIPCKQFKFAIGGKSAIINRDELFGLMFMFADDKQQEDLIPVVETKVRTITRLLSFKLKKDMKEGEIVKAAYTYFMPEAIVERLLISDPERYRKGEVLTTDKLEKDINKIV